MVAKRTSSAAFPETDSIKRRIQPSPASMPTLRVTNLEHDEVVHQACLLVTGDCPSYENAADDYIEIKCRDSFQNTESCNWPAVKGQWKALVLLKPGQNHLVVAFHHAGGVSCSTTRSIVCQPLLQTPPLHLAILVAKDSPLLMDCPSSKYGAFTSTHSKLDAAIAKFRTTALMWQALTAEDMRKKALSRRSFRLEEEWSADTLSLHGSRGANGQAVPMRNVPKIHIIHTEHTVAELRDPKYAQQNPRASEDQWLHQMFTKALKQHGGPFDSSCRPVVAGLILDSHYSVEQDLILGHAAVGCHNPDSISLGIFGSHLTYSWPRFLDEVASCLSDATAPGDSVGNDNNECTSMARACLIGQGAFLHEVGRAFGADHTTGIMARGYSKFWAHNFLPQKNTDENEAVWDLEDALRFKSKPHFRLPGDEPVTPAFINVGIEIDVLPSSKEEETSLLQITSTAGLAAVVIGHRTTDLMSGGPCTVFSTSNFDCYDRSKPLYVTALAMNGRTKTVKDAWKLFASKPYIDIPGSSTKLRKRSIKAAGMEHDSQDDEYYPWTVMLRKRSKAGVIQKVSAIDLRVGCTFDGVYVYYPDGSHQNCGPALERDGSPYTFGGHASEKIDIPKRARITKVELGERGCGGWGGLDGVRMTLSTGQVWGHVNADGGKIETLEPGSDEKIVGFYGTSGKYGFCKEFGIITAPKECRVPDAAWDMEALQNTGEDDDEGNKGDGDESMSDGEGSQITVS